MTNTNRILPVVLAGGSGTRLWPLSREDCPKQFLSLLEPNSLLQATLSRVQASIYLPPLVITHEDYRFLVLEQIRQWGGKISALILEPERKGTAVAAALAAHYALTHFGPEVLLLLLPADHFLPDVAYYNRVIEEILETSVTQDYLLTFGIKPTQIEVGFGYIQPGLAISSTPAFCIQAFIEKPAYDQAKQFCESGDYYWNSGMFLLRPEFYLQELNHFEPILFKQLEKVLAETREVEDLIYLRSDRFSSLIENSIDYAVMEKTDRSAVIPLGTAWYDLGSWSSVLQAGPRDERGNACIGDVVVSESDNCLIRSRQRLLVAIGVKNLVMIETPDAVLVMDQAYSQALKQVVGGLKQVGRQEVLKHQIVHRPWGHFETIMAGERFQVKLIVVWVGACLSLQIHHHRSEHWVVVKGAAQVTRGAETFLLSENQSTYIPIGTAHRLENVGKIPLEMVEIQSGAYLGEDDIVRLEDIYGRVGERVPELSTD